MTDIYEMPETEEGNYISSTAPVQPQKYNIVLTRHGQEIGLDFPPAGADLIARFGYILPKDDRCKAGLVHEEDDLYTLLGPVLGNSFKGELAYHTRKQSIISLHETAILGYQKQVIIDPRISNEVADFWEIYLDLRVFPQADDKEWQKLMAEIIVDGRTNPEADRLLAEDIKDRLLEQTK